jgi:hypothetical protein
MRSALLSRLKRLEEVRAEELQKGPPIVEYGYVVKKLPPDYSGPRHLVTVGRLPNGWHEWEERPEPPRDDQANTGRQRLHVIFVPGPARDNVEHTAGGCA